jgi:3-isopropylmalate dehydratase small subunit
MPDFARASHRGETFVIAGDRFGIGSSREMSPAGLKAIADEAGRTMVIVCGDNMGDIFRRNALNLGACRSYKAAPRSTTRGWRRAHVRSVHASCSRM